MKRVSKEPEVRKQEILDAAVELFAKNGYEKTSMADIARHIKVAQGLCYRYFPSKEALYESAMDEYAYKIVEKINKTICNSALTLLEKLQQYPGYQDVRDEEDQYFCSLQAQQGGPIYDRLTMRVCTLMLPVVEDVLREACAKGEIAQMDFETAASFCIFGQLGVLQNTALSNEAKNIKIRDFLETLLAAMQKQA